MKITCTGHSGFLVELDQINLIFDFFTDRLNVITPEIFSNKRTYAFASHSHHDHFNKKIFDWRERGDVTYILDGSCRAPKDAKAVTVNEGDDVTIDDIRVQTYGSTDAGVSFLATAAGVSIFHAGDLNDWYWAEESTPEELAADEEAYLRILRQIAGQHIDVAFIPEDPRLKEHAGRGIRFFKEIVNPKRIVPMHYAGNESVVR